MRESGSPYLLPEKPCRNPWVSALQSSSLDTREGTVKNVKREMLRARFRDNVLDYVSRFRTRLHHARSVARETLNRSQTVMKHSFDRSAIARRFEVRDEVPPEPGASLSACFARPFRIFVYASSQRH